PRRYRNPVIADTRSPPRAAKIVGAANTTMAVEIAKATEISLNCRAGRDHRRYCRVRPCNPNNSLGVSRSVVSSGAAWAPERPESKPVAAAVVLLDGVHPSFRRIPPAWASAGCPAARCRRDDRGFSCAHLVFTGANLPSPLYVIYRERFHLTLTLV